MAKKKGGKKLRRVAFRRNRNQPARDNSWTREYREHQFEDKATQSRQTAIPKGDMSRKRTIVESEDPAAGLLRGVVVAMRGLYADVDTAEGPISCTTRRILRTRLIDERHPVTVGDHVLLDPADPTDGDGRSGVIQHVEPRRSQLIRRYAKRSQVIVANVDQVLIVASLREPTLKPQLIDRYIVAAHAGNITPILCLNKLDLDDDMAEPITALYTAIGYRVLCTSTASGAGIDALRAVLRDRISAVVGQSGVGKSSLLNTVQPDLQLSTATVSTVNEKGRHTTTGSRLIKLDIGGYVADTPGIRSYELAHVERSAFEEHFRDIAPFVPLCKFPDCTHIHETECAVRDAVDDGRIHPLRYESYTRLFEDG